MRFVFAGTLLLIGSSAFVQAPKDPHVFDYDQKAPLDIQDTGVKYRGDIAIHDLSYASPKGGRVPAYLVVPEGKGPFAAVIWGHWYWKNSEFFNRKEFLDEAVALAHVGVVSLLTTGPGARPGHVDDKDSLSDQNMADLVQQVVDMRRGADLLLGRQGVDSNRLAYVGHSYNASVGGFLSGIDKRFKAFVLMAGDLSNEVDLASEQFQKIRQNIGPEKFNAFAARYVRLDPGTYVSHAAPAAVFMQFATQENFLTPERVRKYAELVSEPKEFKLYDAPHALNAEARRDRIAFLTEQLRLSLLSPELIDAIPDLPQPPTPTAFFREPLPGEAGQRNILRGDGCFGVDAGLAKRWKMPYSEKHSLQLRWEVFNVTNSTRFDAQSTNNAIDSFGSSSGNYTRLLTNPRVMQFALRYEF